MFEEMGRLPQPRGKDCERPGLFLHAHLVTIKKITELIKGRFPQHRQNVSSKPTGVTRKGATASRLGKEETSQEEEAAAPLLAPSTGRRSCATGAPAPRAPPPPRPSPYARLRSPRPFKVPPKSNYASASSYPGPISTKFHGKLPPRARPVPDNRWAVAPAGLGLP